MASKDIDGQEVVLWVLAAIVSLGITVSYITTDQSSRKPDCVSLSEVSLGGILLDSNRDNNVCKD